MTCTECGIAYDNCSICSENKCFECNTNYVLNFLGD